MDMTKGNNNFESGSLKEEKENYKNSIIQCCEIIIYNHKIMNTSHIYLMIAIIQLYMHSIMFILPLVTSPINAKFSHIFLPY